MANHKCQCIVKLLCLLILLVNNACHVHDTFQKQVKDLFKSKRTYNLDRPSTEKRRVYRFGQKVYIFIERAKYLGMFETNVSFCPVKEFLLLLDASDVTHSTFFTEESFVCSADKKAWPFYYSRKNNEVSLYRCFHVTLVVSLK